MALIQVGLRGHTQSVTTGSAEGTGNRTYLRSTLLLPSQHGRLLLNRGQRPVSSKRRSGLELCVLLERIRSIIDTVGLQVVVHQHRRELIKDLARASVLCRRQRQQRQQPSSGLGLAGTHETKLLYLAPAPLLAAPDSHRVCTAKGPQFLSSIGYSGTSMVSFNENEHKKHSELVLTHLRNPAAIDTRSASSTVFADSSSTVSTK